MVNLCNWFTNKKLAFSHSQIQDPLYYNKNYGKANFVDDVTIKYTIPSNLKINYMVLFSVDVYDGEVSDNNYKTTLTNFAKVFQTMLIKLKHQFLFL